MCMYLRVFCGIRFGYNVLNKQAQNKIIEKAERFIKKHSPEKALFTWSLDILIFKTYIFLQSLGLCQIYLWKYTWIFLRKTSLAK